MTEPRKTRAQTNRTGGGVSRDVGLIFPHQLFEDHPAVSPGRDVVLIEDSLFFGDERYPARFHKHKLILHRASMTTWSEAKRCQGINVRHLSYQPGRSCRQVLQELCREGATAFFVVDPTDFLLRRRLESACRELGAELRILPTPLFLTPKDWLEEWFHRPRPWLQ